MYLIRSWCIVLLIMVVIQIDWLQYYFVGENIISVYYLQELQKYTQIKDGPQISLLEP